MMMPKRIRDCSTCCFSTAVHSSSVQGELAASGDHTNNVRSVCFSPLLIAATKFAPVSMFSSPSHGSKPLAVMAAASFSTNSLSRVLWERKTFIGLATSGELWSAVSWKRSNWRLAISDSKRRFNRVPPLRGSGSLLHPYPGLTSLLRNSVVPTGLGSNFPLDPALRLRLRAGLDYCVPTAL